MKRWPQRKDHFWESAPFFRIVLPFAAGIWCYDMCQGARMNTLIAFAATLLAFVLLFLLNKYKPLLFVVSQVCMALMGVTAAYYADVHNDGSWYGHTAGKGYSYLVTIAEPPVEKEHSWKLTVNVTEAIKQGTVLPVSGKAFVYLYKDAPMLLHKGDSVLVTDKWMAIRNAGNPYEFDYARYCLRNNIVYQQICGAKDMRLYATNDEQATPMTTRAHDLSMQQLDQYLPDSIAKGLIQAMLLGDEVNLDEDLRQSYADTGIIHIIAISGGNVLIFFNVISLLLFWLRNKRHLWIKYAIALPLVWFYVVMAGAPPSAVRAAIMFTLLAVSMIADKHGNPLNTLLAAAFILLFGEPMWLFSVGFQLSFTAVLSLILFYQPIKMLLSPKNKILYKLWTVAAASLAAEILVAPMVVYYFHTFPVMFLVANVLAFVFMEVVLGLSMAVIIVSVAPVAATVTGWITVKLVNIFDAIIKTLQMINPTSFHFLMINGMELLIIYILIVLLAVFLMKQNKVALFGALAGCSVLLACLCIDEYNRCGQERLVVYNTGKANRVELIRGNKYMVLHSDTTALKKQQYVVNIAHIYMRAWQQDSAVNGNIMTIAGKKVLLLNEDRRMTGKFPVDEVVVNLNELPDAAKLKAVYDPAVATIGNKYSRKQREQFGRQAKGCGLKVHDVATDGAFIVSE